MTHACWPCLRGTAPRASRCRRCCYARCRTAGGALLRWTSSSRCGQGQFRPGAACRPPARSASSPPCREACLPDTRSTTPPSPPASQHPCPAARPLPRQPAARSPGPCRQAAFLLACERPSCRLLPGCLQLQYCLIDQLLHGPDPPTGQRAADEVAALMRTHSALGHAQGCHPHIRRAPPRPAQPLPPGCPGQAPVACQGSPCLGRSVPNPRSLAVTSSPAPCPVAGQQAAALLGARLPAARGAATEHDLQHLSAARLATCAAPHPLRHPGGLWPPLPTCLADSPTWWATAPPITATCTPSAWPPASGRQVPPLQ